MVETNTPLKSLFDTDNKPAVEALAHAQFIAFAPYVFHASIALRDTNILKEVEASRSNGLTIEEVAEKVGMSHYAVRVLLEGGLGIGLVYRKGDRFLLAKTGHFFINHPFTKINTDFINDVCYDGAKELLPSLKDGKPRGLEHLGNWETIYQGLSTLPEPAKTSWFKFDHYYSDNTYEQALPLIFANNPKKILDIGANTGRFSKACLNYNSEVELGLVDLKNVLDIAREEMKNEGYTERVSFHDRDVLKDEAFPKGFDVMWMSQFLDCFSEPQIISILSKCHAALNDGGSIFINETFWDRQKFEAFAFSLQMTSLYFTTMANGNSQMYNSQLFKKLVNEAGFEVVSETDNVGLGHSIFELKKK